MTRRSQGADPTPLQRRTLTALATHGGALTVKEIAAAAGGSVSGVAGGLKMLRAYGLVDEPVRDKVGRGWRARIRNSYVITDAGRAALEQADRKEVR